MLNWMLEGWTRLRADNWQVNATAAQSKVVGDLLLESESYVHFCRERVRRIEGGSFYGLILRDCYTAYVRFCAERGWTPLSMNNFGPKVETAIPATI